MMKFLIFFLIIIINCKLALSRNSGETEITTDDGIEVFQDEKYYLLKKNVEIFSDELELKGQIVKIYFENDLYDIQKLIANDQVSFISEQYNLFISSFKYKYLFNESFSFNFCIFLLYISTFNQYNISTNHQECSSFCWIVFIVGTYRDNLVLHFGQ